MKKLLALLLCASVLLTLPACGGGGSKKDLFVQNGKTTLMIYMVGSDLESKSGAATDDLVEIQESGIDTAHNDVVICAGGSPEWQNDSIKSEKNTILTLSGDSYEVERTTQSESMGKAKTLSDFLNYCVKNHPAEHYALVLWNHGNGPLIGYGKDMLFDNDSLTLSEMKEAMDNSPFSAENKLDWVGFDACLMASAELSCVWAPYAGYLVASQEVEPAFGWQYSFLKNFGKVETTELITAITENYLGACLDYYEKKGYSDRDTTLACVDLSYGDELREAVNGLFAEAAKNVDKHYDELAARRVNTRALGRASTGSEYDLVDLNDLSKQLEKDYPEQSKALCGVIGKMVVSNRTNAQGLSGMSLYYPFYNKNYYQNEWSKLYRDMEVFSAYIDYLSKYEKTWLGEDMQEDYATSEQPEAESSNEYVLQLTDDQAKHFASAKYYILKREGKETFTKIYSSADVQYEDGKLTANFDGNVIYAHNEFSEYILPVATEHDTVGDNTHYSVKVVLSDTSASRLVDKVFDSSPSDGEESSSLGKKKGCRFLITADNKTKKISVSGLLPNDQTLDETHFTSGKPEEVDLSEFTTYMFYQEAIRTMVRSDKGVIQAVDKWQDQGSVLWNEMSIANGLDFVYAPLGYGEYALVFEISDTQNNLYCSEPIEVDTSGVDWLEQAEKPDKSNLETINVKSDGKYPLLLKEDKDIALYLDRFQAAEELWYNDTLVEHDYLTLYAVNKTDKTLAYRARNMICNDTIDCSDGSGISEKLAAGAKEQAGISDDSYDKLLKRTGSDLPSETFKKPDYFDFGIAALLGKVKKLSSLQFDVTLNEYDNDKILWNEQPFRIVFDKGSEYEIKEAPDTYDDTNVEPLYDADIREQTVCEEKDKYKVELVKIGLDGENRLKAFYHISNLSDKDTLYYQMDGLAIDDIYIDCKGKGIELPPGKECYYKQSNEHLDEAGITGVQKLTVSMRTAANDTILWSGFGDVSWHNVKLTKSSKSPSEINLSGKVLLDEHDVLLRYNGYEEEDFSIGNDGSDLTQYWRFSLVNNAGEGVKLGFMDLIVDGKKYPDNQMSKPVHFTDDANVGSGQSRLLALRSGSDAKKIKKISFIPVIYDFTGEKILFTGSKPIELKTE